MMTTAVATLAEVDPVAPEAAEEPAQGWYFYGITRRGRLPAALAALDGEYQIGGASTCTASDAAPLRLLEFSGLAAVVRPVLLADFSLAALRERLQNASALEATVRSHNRVIEAIHAHRGMLPAKFGMVYAHAQDVVSALRSAHDALLNRLQRLHGCDEWAVHLYANRAAVRERTATESPAIRRLRDDRDAARPGRAYFLEQQLRDALDAATEQALSTQAQKVFDRLSGSAVAGQVNPLGPTADLVGEEEILRAGFLVARDGAAHFEEEVRSVADASVGLRCESSGPWPPYSFAAWNDEEAE